MTDERKAKKTEKQGENLDLNKETVADLTEQEGEQVKGGLVAHKCEPGDTSCCPYTEARAG